MRTLGFRTHVLVAVAAAIAVLAALGRPWYAPARLPEGDNGVHDLHGPVHDLTDAIVRWTGGADGATGWDALGQWGTALAALAVLTAVGAVGCIVPALQGAAREVLRYAALGLFCIATWKLLDTPGPNIDLEPRVGAFVAAGASLVAVTAGWAVAAAPMRRRRPSTALIGSDPL
jgi:hypothetical protein